MDKSKLEFRLAWGWNEFFSNQLADLDAVIGRVIGEEKNRWRVQISAEQSVWVELSGKYRFQNHSRAELPSVGDWVTCKYEQNQAVGLLLKVFQRQSCLYRKEIGSGGDIQILASNVHYAFVLTSANADLNIARLERYVSLIWDSGAQPVIVVTKSELARSIEEMLEMIRQRFAGVDVFAISVQEKQNLESLQKYLQVGKSIVLLGSSGVGKSTLSNYLLGDEVLATKEIRVGDDRGKHTTTSRYLFPLNSGAFIIDTPGMRLLPLMDQAEGVDSVFSDIAELEVSCRFRDCRHITEPGCAVLSALEDGVLDEGRWNRYLKLQRELQRKQKPRSGTGRKNKSN